MAAPHPLRLAKVPPHARSYRATALIFADPASVRLQERIARTAQSEATVLITGETGTGKEIVARELHRSSRRAHGPFVAVNCGALPEHVVESELFGHERGAFTGATEQRRGWFEAASGGTLFLDEVGDLPLAMQVKLLRVLQEREVNRVGSRVPIPIDVRVVAATNVGLEQAVREGRFREDLYFRINVAKLELPPLRARPGDIVPLARYLVAQTGEREGRALVLTADAEAALLRYPWPGNIRELENVIQQAALSAVADEISAATLAFPGEALASVALPDTGASRSSDLSTAFDALAREHTGALHATIEARLIAHALRRSGNNQVRAAHLLGLSRNVLRHRMKQYGFLDGRLSS